jgi:uncharacterized ferritin-like protein (DUF455 family)
LEFFSKWIFVGNKYFKNTKPTVFTAFRCGTVHVSHTMFTMATVIAHIEFIVIHLALVHMNKLLQHSPKPQFLSDLQGIPLQFSLQWPKIDPQQKVFAGHSVWLLHNCKVTQGCRIHVSVKT